MHSATTAEKTLRILWTNYLMLCEQVDPEAMPREVLRGHVARKSPVHTFRIAAWLARQGYFIAAWARWEYYARRLCQNLANKEKRQSRESIVDWVGRSLAANSMDFDHQEWFCSANALRNLIAHYGGRAVDSEAVALLQRSRTAFQDIETWKDGYVEISHSDLSDVKINIEDFIRNTA